MAHSGHSKEEGGRGTGESGKNGSPGELAGMARSCAFWAPGGAMHHTQAQSEQREGRFLAGNWTLLKKISFSLSKNLASVSHPGKYPAWREQGVMGLVLTQ